MPVKGGYLLLAGAGGIVFYAGLKGKNLGSAFRDILAGKSPKDAAAANQITVGGYGVTGSSPGGAIAGYPNVPESASEKAVFTAMCAGGGWPPTGANINSLHAWRLRESTWGDGGPDDAEITHNPFNTTMPGFGATGNVNSVGVKIYPDWGQGIAATVTTIGAYPSILNALVSGKGLCGGDHAADFMKWSGGGYSSVC